MEPNRDAVLVDNDLYHQMGEAWYRAEDHPVALLRSESRVKNRWILDRLVKSKLSSDVPVHVLDVGCGAGFFCNEASRHGFAVTGIDLADDALGVAARFDDTKSVRYLRADAHHLPFKDGEFDFVVSLDFLEHTPDPATVISEIARVVKPGGGFFFHTFNRNWLSHLVAIKGVEWFVKNTPPNLHAIELFIKPVELGQMCANVGLTAVEWRGIRPVFNRSFLRLLVEGLVDDDFEFRETSSLKISYLGFAQKRKP